MPPLAKCHCLRDAMLSALLWRCHRWHVNIANTTAGDLPLQARGFRPFDCPSATPTPKNAWRVLSSQATTHRWLAARGQNSALLLEMYHRPSAQKTSKHLSQGGLTTRASPARRVRGKQPRQKTSCNARFTADYCGVAASGECAC